MIEKTVATRTMNLMNCSTNLDNVRRENFQGVEHLVVPIIALVEGVIHSGNAPYPELALSEEFGRIPVSWNGRPVTLNHPMRDGLNVSASESPTVFEEEALGFLFNTTLDGTKLKTEAWINLETVANASQEVKDTIARFENPAANDVVEVSTGLFVNSEASRGRFNNEQFQGIWRDIVPDHLAILPLGVIGACSVADGCGGPRMNALKVNCACQEKLNDVKIEPTTPAPITNKLVLDPENESLERNRFLRGLKEKFAGLFFTANAGMELSDRDTRTAIASALAAENDEKWYDIVAVFKKEFIYSSSWDGSLDQRSYKISTDGTVALGSETVRVRPETTFVPVTFKEDSRMNKKALIDGLIANSATQFEESDRATLETMSEEVLAKLAPKETPAVNKEVPAVVAEPVAAPAVNKAPATPEEFLAAAPKEIQAVLNSGLAMHRERKDSLVKGLMANSRNTFKEDALRAMEMSTLEGLAKLADVPSFDGRQGATFSTNDSNAVPEAPKLFPTKQ